MQNVSVCITVYNEEATIEELLTSLFRQTKKPSEIVICDGGSTDKTIQIIQRLQKKNKSIRLFTSFGNVAHGRNFAIRNAKYSIIATIDAGCVAKKDWLENLLKGYGMTMDVVAGFYEMKWKTPFQKIMALYRGTHPKRYDPNSFIPSCRSVAFTKSLWKSLGGFDETLTLSGEDTQFFNQAVVRNKKIARVQNACVEWKEPEQFTYADFVKFFHYAKGDAQTGIWWDPVKKWRTHNIKIVSIWVRYLFLIMAILSIYKYTSNWISAFAGMTSLLFLYGFWSIWKWRDVVTKWNERLWIPVVQVGTDVMVMTGFLVGVLHY